MTTPGNLLDLGLRDYLEVWELQRKLVELRANKAIRDTLILVEHPHVFTVGKGVQGQVPSEINGVPVIRIERGGEWTYHGPGQLVGYPILDLNARGRDIHDFLRKIEETIILAVADSGIIAERNRLQTGVWVGNEKLASIGAAIRNWISFHGFALNINTDLKFFHMISPCGFSGDIMTSMQVLIGHPIDHDKTNENVHRNFEKVFGIELRPTNIQTIFEGPQVL
jgi:lipoate-protein ligase B